MIRQYEGQELQLFAEAPRWKEYVAALLRPHLRGEVLEVGAGLGSTTSALCNGSQTAWLCLEPDPGMAARLDREIAAGNLPACCRTRCGSVADLDAEHRFDCILYIDVLEHVESDREELERAARHLKSAGTLIVLAPAHPWLYSPFDSAVGHFRRYTKRSLAEAAPPDLPRVTLCYLDSAGMLASGANRIVLRQSLPTRREIVVWDRFLVPVSRALDPLLGFKVGRSLLAVWRAADGSAGRSHPG